MSPAANLGANLRALREARGFSQAQISRIAGVPRPTWTNLESGEANPTLAVLVCPCGNGALAQVAVLVKVAESLQVRLEELLSPPRAVARHYPAGTLPMRTKGTVSVRKLLPEHLAGLDIERMEFPAGAHMAGVPHTAGTREYLTCETGAIELAVAGTSYRLTPGDVVVFRGDQKHGYRNRAKGTSIAYAVVAFAPTGS